ncbi:MAG: STAS domain-containing protein [Acidobacteriota bacterium]|nr:STAS domain-containing protein [Acidobacteriota bacterium]MDE3044518.1 STAS domain-containing protein [Acidobacteriota bacterium]MDE3107537.1 STAS domain-containing protein [Acidobacteriota bacterium]MDE3222135.1 STAS domain-containing protein [Acidobacteriota bacterium]
MTTFASTTTGSTLVVRPEGRLDLVAAPELREIVAKSIAGGVVNVVVDLAEVDFLDSSGLGALVTGLKSTRQAGGNLRIARAPEQALIVLDLTMMQQVLFPYPSVEEALEAP